MKTCFCILLTAMIAVTCVYGADEKKDTAYRVRRGVNNVMLGWLEIPRNIIYEDAKTPYAGFFYGLVKGPVMTVWRGTAGVVDLVALGQTGPGLYMGQIPDSPIDAAWYPDKSKAERKAAKKEKKAEKKAAKKEEKLKPVKKVEKKAEKKAEKVEKKAEKKAVKAEKKAEKKAAKTE